MAVFVLRSFGQLPIVPGAKNIGSQGWPSEIVLDRARSLLVRGLSSFVGGASRKRIVYLRDAYIANFSMDASPAVTAFLFEQTSRVSA